MKINKRTAWALLVLFVVVVFCRWYNRHEYIKAPAVMPVSQAERFHWIISIVESTLDLRASKGDSRGIVQVSSLVTDELKDVYGTKYSPSMCMGNKELSWHMMDLYLDQPAMHQAFGPNPSWTVKAGVWKDGRSGYQHGRSREYIKKCKRIEAERGWGGPNSLFK